MIPQLSNDDAQNEQAKTTLTEMTKEQINPTLQKISQKNFKKWVWISYFFLIGMIICWVCLLYYGYQKNDDRCMQFMFLGLIFTLGAGITYRIDVLIELISLIFSK